MGKYIHYCADLTAFNDAYGSMSDDEPFVSYTADGYDLVTYSPALSNIQNAANGYDYVDLDLPSGTLWATCNVGANSPTTIGDYFNWGDVIPYTSTEQNDYKWYSNGDYTKYNNVDGLTIVELEDDAANYNMGGEWHIPSRKQINELKNNTTITFSGNNMKFTSLVDSSKYIILPAGNARNPRVSYGWARAIIWSSDCHYLSGTGGALDCYKNPPTWDNIARCGACNVRGVLDRERKVYRMPRLPEVAE